MNTETKTTINDDVHQDVPTDLTNVTIIGSKTYDDQNSCPCGCGEDKGEYALFCQFCRLEH